MDCCSKYPTDYTRPCHHTIPPPSISGISGCSNNSSIMSNTNLYGSRLVHPSLRYQSPLNRNGFPPPIGYDGFVGPPPSLPSNSTTLGNSLPPSLPSHPYQNYDLRYDPNSRNYSNYISSNGSTPLYPYSNSNGFSYGHLNNRFYNHHYHHQQQQQQHQQQQHYYDSYGRIIGTPYSYQHQHNYHTIRNSSNLNGSSNSAYHHHIYGNRQNSPYHPLHGLDYHHHIPPQSTTQQYYLPHHSQHHQHHLLQNGNNTIQNFNNNNLYQSHMVNVTDSHHHNDILHQQQQQQQYLAQQENNLTKDYLPRITNNTQSTEQIDETNNNRYSVNDCRETDIDCDGIIEINSNSDKDINNGRCNSTQSIVNSPLENSTTSNTNNNDSSGGGGSGCGTTIFNSELTVASSPLTNVSADSGISGCGDVLYHTNNNNNNNNNSKNDKENYDNENNCQIENDDDENERREEEICENKQNIEQMILKIDKDNQSSDVDSTDLKETKPFSELKSVKDLEKIVNRISDSSKRKLDCSTPLTNTSPILESSTTPFIHNNNQQQYHQQQYNHHQHNNSNYQSSRYLNSSPATNHNNNNNNYHSSPYYQNCYTPPNNHRSNWSPYSSPHYNYPYSNYSPTSTTIKSSISSIRKQQQQQRSTSTFSPISSNNRRRKQPQQQQQQRKKPITKTTTQTTASLLTQTIITNKNRVLECDFIPSKKSKRKNQSESEDSFEFREEIKDIKPLPGFQQAFGSTEIGRFSEIFFNTTPDNLYDNYYGYESEFDTSMSPYPWETGDSLEGPHFNLHIGAPSLKSSCYTDHLNSIINDTPLLETNSNNYFSGIRCNEY